MSDILLPTAFEPIAYILYDSNYKARLIALIRNAPKNIVNDPNWWKQLKSVTGASNEEIKNIRTQHIDIKKQTTQKTGKVFDKLADTPVIRQDPELQNLIKTFAQNLSEGAKKTAELIALQKKVQQRIQQLDEKIRQKEIELANTKKTPQITESKEIIVEGFLSKTISKVRQYLASDAFKNLLNIGEDGDQNSIKEAQTIVRDILQVICDKTYEKLKNSGIDKRTLIKAYQTRKNKSSLELLSKAKNIITNKTPAPASVQPSQKETTQSPQKEAVQSPQKETTQSPHNEISMMKQMMDAARRKAKASGIDEFQAAENELQKFEEKGVDNVGVVRRQWDKYREHKKATQP